MPNETHVAVESNDEQHSEPSDSAFPISRRAALGGLLGLGLLSSTAAAQPPARRWNSDQTANGYRLLDLGALTMRDNDIEIRDFEGTNLEIEDGVLNAIVESEEFELLVGRYLDFDDDDTLQFTGPAEWQNKTTTSVNEASGENATVGGGHSNVASGENATVAGGGGENEGDGNPASGRWASVGGGQSNIASSFQATVGGGILNRARGDSATVAGGASNEASDIATTVGGGSGNKASGFLATVAGGASNEASGTMATIPGGQRNIAAGRSSFAAGRYARANHDGAFVFGDSSMTTISSNGADEARFQMPVYAESFNTTSTRTKKTNTEPVDPQQALAGVESLDVSTWEFTDSDGGRHMGPMAEEFFETFGLGDSDDSIASVDADGVAFAAIQGLSAKLEQKDERIAELYERLATLEERVGVRPVAADGGTVGTED
ncbi:tail fiber domain-containing protein [Halalkaliarchaeum sp. AArc-CO]|uniref:tail fiber domain-containing protein n=1 Tax=Halalkaliarchaeum sp. AArc-CO TaxID=2866381 RepID=UPI00217E2296|nr:tail fiber domain-containing protein [Halalkaliarchaeum sp. AArc-CO]